MFLDAELGVITWEEPTPDEFWLARFLANFSDGSRADDVMSVLRSTALHISAYPSSVSAAALNACFDMFHENMNLADRDLTQHHNFSYEIGPVVGTGFIVRFGLSSYAALVPDTLHIEKIGTYASPIESVDRKAYEQALQKSSGCDASVDIALEAVVRELNSDQPKVGSAPLHALALATKERRPVGVECQISGEKSMVALHALGKRSLQT